MNSHPTPQQLIEEAERSLPHPDPDAEVVIGNLVVCHGLCGYLYLIVGNGIPQELTKEAAITFLARLRSPLPIPSFPPLLAMTTEKLPYNHTYTLTLSIGSGADLSESCNPAQDSSYSEAEWNALSRDQQEEWLNEEATSWADPLVEIDWHLSPSLHR